MLHRYSARFSAGWGPLTNRALTWLCVLAIGLLPVLNVDAQQADDVYLRVFNLIGTADDLAKKSDNERALAKYREAHKILENLKREFPEWNPQVVKFRSQYLASRINELMNPPIETQTRPGATTNAVGASEASATGLRVEVLEPGAEPRQVLRWQPEAGTRQLLLLTQKTSMSIKAGDAPARPMSLPPINITLEVNVKEVSPEGDIAYETVIQEAGIAQDTNSNPQANLMLSSLLAPFKGASASGVITAAGFPKSLKINLPQAASAAMAAGGSDQLQQLFGEIALPFPEEAVGPGAKWRVTKPSTVQGVRLVESATHSLVKLEDGRLQVQTQAENKAGGSQKVQNVEITRLEVQTSGELTFELTQLMPQAASLRSRTASEQKQRAAGSSQAVSSVINTELSIQTK